MSIAERKIRHKENIRANILEVAWQIVREDGWESLSMRKIADAIEYSTPVIYNHFQNKEAILYEFSLDGFKKLHEILEKVEKKYTDPKEKLRGFAVAYWNFAFKHKEYYQLMYGLGISCCDMGKKNPEVNTFRDYISKAIETIIKQKKSHTTDFCFKIYGFWSVLHGLISIRFMRNLDLGDTMNRKVMEDTVDAFIKNL